MKRILLILFACELLIASSTRADTFGSGANSFDIQFVTIGNPNNPADTTGDPNPAGSVPYVYRIGKYEISEQMIDKANALGALGLTKDTRGPDKPATSLSWFEAAKIVNWLNTSTAASPAYKFDTNGNFQLWATSDPGYDATNLFRNTLARYFLPSDNEWYKAAYYDPGLNNYWDFATGSDIAPTPVASGAAPGTAVWNQTFDQGPADVGLAGGLSQYGTAGQSGNVFEWLETEVDFVNDTPGKQRGVRGGVWYESASPVDMSSTFRNYLIPQGNPDNVGFRIASTVPEPCGFCPILSALLTFVLRYRRPTRPCSLQ